MNINWQQILLGILLSVGGGLMFSSFNNIIFKLVGIASAVAGVAIIFIGGMGG